MLAAFATLVFAGTLWLTFVLLAGLLEESGGRIVAAAQGLPLAVRDASGMPLNRRGRVRDHRLPVPRTDWRAAA